MKFWMCMNPSKGYPTKIHEDYASAKEEAERLCRKECCRIYILEATSFVELTESPVRHCDINE